MTISSTEKPKIVALNDSNYRSVPYALRWLADEIEQGAVKPDIAVVVAIYPDKGVGLWSAGILSDDLRCLGALQIGVATLTDLIRSPDDHEKAV